MAWFRTSTSGSTPPFVRRHVPSQGLWSGAACLTRMFREWLTVCTKMCTGPKNYPLLFLLHENVQSEARLQPIWQLAGGDVHRDGSQSWFRYPKAGAGRISLEMPTRSIGATSRLALHPRGRLHAGGEQHRAVRPAMTATGPPPRGWRADFVSWDSRWLLVRCESWVPVVTGPFGGEFGWFGRCCRWRALASGAHRVRRRVECSVG